MTTPRYLLDVMIPTLGQRAESFQKLLASLNAQIARYGLAESVVVSAYADNGEVSQGAKRNSLWHNCRGRYGCGVDDDDEVACDYLPSIVEQLHAHGDVDVVTFRAQRTEDGQPQTAQTLIYDLCQRSNQVEPSDIVLLQPNHICVWKTAIARLARHAEDLSYGSDQVWWKSLLLAGYARTQVHIPRVLYHYKFRRDQADGVRHDRATVLEAHRMMGPGWKRGVWKHRVSGELVARPTPPELESEYDFLGEVRLS